MTTSSRWRPARCSSTRRHWISPVRPGHGEHTDALLAELGFSEDEIIEFKINSVVL